MKTEIQHGNLNFGQDSASAFAENIVKNFSTGKHKIKNLRVDDRLRDEADNSVALFVVQYGDGNENMTKT